MQISNVVHKTRDKNLPSNFVNYTFDKIWSKIVALLSVTSNLGNAQLAIQQFCLWGVVYQLLTQDIALVHRSMTSLSF